MKTDEQVQKELEDAGLTVDRDVAGNLRGTLMFQFMRGGRGYIYPTKDGNWGWVSEDYVVSDLAADNITKHFPGVRRGNREDKPVVGNDSPEYVISGMNKEALAYFVRLFHVLTHPGIVKKRHE